MGCGASTTSSLSKDVSGAQEMLAQKASSPPTVTPPTGSIEKKEETVVVVDAEESDDEPLEVIIETQPKQQASRKELEEAAIFQAKCCPNGHILKFFTREDGGTNYCNGCGKQGIRQPEHVFRCGACDSDLCDQCYSGKACLEDAESEPKSKEPQSPKPRYSLSKQQQEEANKLAERRKQFDNTRYKRITPHDMVGAGNQSKLPTDMIMGLNLTDVDTKAQRQDIDPHDALLPGGILDDVPDVRPTPQKENRHSQDDDKSTGFDAGDEMLMNEILEHFDD